MKGVSEVDIVELGKGAVGEFSRPGFCLDLSHGCWLRSRVRRGECDQTRACYNRTLPPGLGLGWGERWYANDQESYQEAVMVIGSY